MNEPQTVAEAHLLLAILRQRWETASAAMRGRGPLGRSFFDLCDACDVAGRVDALLADRREWLDEAAQKAFDTLRARRQRDNLLLFAVAGQAIDLLAEVGVEPVALKGFDLAQRGWYAFDSRGFDDVDLLLPAETLPDVIRRFGEAGWTIPDGDRFAHYVRSSHHLAISSPGPIPIYIELHWNLAQEGRFTIDAAGLIARARPMEADGRRLLRMDDADIVAHLLLHQFTHYFDRRLKWLVDMAFLVEGEAFDPSAVVERVRAWGATRAVGAALAQIDKLWPELALPELRRALPYVGWRRALASPLHSSHPLDLFRSTRRRSVQLYLAALFLERASQLPGWLLHRQRRDHVEGVNPLDPGSAGGDGER